MRKKRPKKPSEDRKKQTKNGKGKSRRRAELSTETLEPRILLSATWVDADTGDALEEASDGNDIGTGSDAADILNGLDGNDQLFGGDGDDELSGESGDDELNGGEGTDTAKFSGNLSDYTIEEVGDGQITITDNRDGSPDGTDTVTNVENFEFADGVVDLETLTNDAPTVETQDVIASEGDTVSLSVSAEDQDGDDLTYTWKQVSGPEVELDDATSDSPIFEAPDVVGDVTEDSTVETLVDLDTYPGGVVENADGETLVSDYSTGKIYQLGEDGELEVVVEGLNGPGLMDRDADGNIYVTEYGGGNIVKIDPDGNMTTVASGVSGPWAMDVDNDGNVFVAEWSTGDVLKITPEGESSVVATGHRWVWDISTDDDGNLYLPNPTGGSVDVISTDGSVNTISTGQITRPTGATATSDGGMIVSEQSIGNLYKVSAAGEVTVLVGGNDPNATTAGDLDLTYPSDVTVTEDGRVLVADWGTGKVHEIDPEPGQEQITFEVTVSDGTDRYLGGNGVDTIDASQADTLGMVYLHTNDSIEQITGSDSGTTIQGTDAYNYLNFANTNLENIDAIDAGGGNDYVIGSAGNDTIIGGTGNDTLRGGDGDDTFVYAEGDGMDRFIGGNGIDTIDASQADTLELNRFYNTDAEQITGSDSGTTIQGTDGYDYLDFRSTTLENIDSIELGAGNDYVYGSSGNDTFEGGAGNDTIRAGDGQDTIVLSGNMSDYTVTENSDGSLTLADNRGIDGTDRVFQAESFQFADQTVEANTLYGQTLVGGEGNDYLNGRLGDDTIIGNGGNDRLIGGEGADEMYGGSGNDVLYADGDDTVIDGGDGYDYLRRGGAGSMDVNLNDANIENVDFYNSTDDHTFDATGKTDNVWIRAGEGNDAVTAEDLLNEAPADLTFTGGTVAENSENGTEVARASVVDTDGWDEHTYELSDNADGRFTIDAETGVITVADGSKLDYEDATSHEITVTVTDASGETYEETLTIELSDVDDTAQAANIEVTPVADAADLFVSPVAGLVGETIDLRIAAELTDADGSETLTVRITGMPNDAQLNTGVLADDGSWLLTSDQLAGLRLTLPNGSANSFSLSVTAISLDANGDQTEVTKDLEVRVDAPVVLEEVNPVDPTADEPAHRTTDEIENQLHNAETLVESSLSESERQVSQQQVRIIPTGETIVAMPPAATNWNAVEFGEIKEVDPAPTLTGTPVVWEGRTEGAAQAQQDIYDDAPADSGGTSLMNSWSWMWGMMRAYGGTRNDNAASDRQTSDQRNRR